MKCIKSEEAEFYEGEGFSGLDYPMSDKDINFAVIKIDGQSPINGYQVNEKCKELLYIIEGKGLLEIKNGEEKEFKKGDLLIIEQGERYRFSGTFEAAVPCTPAWTEEQHKYVD